jgi:hypothetical protein
MGSSSHAILTILATRLAGYRYGLAKGIFDINGSCAGERQELAGGEIKEDGRNVIYVSLGRRPDRPR